MKRWFSLLLLVGALLGLSGQGVAFAHVMTIEKAEQAAPASQMSAECAEMMGFAKQEPQSGMPCQGMTPDCVAKMGCAVPLALIPPVLMSEFSEFQAELPWLASASSLVGRNFGPEPEPPARLD